MKNPEPPRDDKGMFGEWKPSPRPCIHCGVTGQRYYRVWESNCGGYEDEENQCRACKKTWWIEGPDA